MTWFRKTLDVLIAAPLRHIAYHVAKRAIERKYLIQMDVDRSVYDIKQGAIVAAKHAHRDDGPLLIVLAWPWAHLRPLVWHKEYRHWLQWPFMITIGAVPGGEGTLHRGRKPGEIIAGLLDHGWGVLIFPGGTVANDGITAVPPRAATIYNALLSNPDKPLVLVTTHGLGRDEVQQRDPASGRQIIRVEVRRCVPDLSCDVATFNRRLADHFNDGVPMLAAPGPGTQPT